MFVSPEFMSKRGVALVLPCLNPMGCDRMISPDHDTDLLQVMIDWINKRWVKVWYSLVALLVSIISLGKKFSIAIGPVVKLFTYNVQVILLVDRLATWGLLVFTVLTVGLFRL